MEPLTALQLGATAIGGLNTLFGSKDKAQAIHPEVQRMMKLFQMNYQNPRGINSVVMDQMKQKLKATLGNEAGALSALTASRINQQGGGAAAQNAAQSRLNSQRLNALGAGLTEIDVANENVKLGQSRNALSALTSIMPNLGFEQQGQGYANLFAMGLDGLLESGALQKMFTRNSTVSNNPYRPRFNPNQSSGQGGLL